MTQPPPGAECAYQDRGIRHREAVDAPFTSETGPESG